MNTADGAGREHLDADLGRDRRGRRHRRGTVSPLCTDDRQRASRALGDRLACCEPDDLIIAQPDTHHAFDDRDGRRDGAGLADRTLQFDPDRGVVRARKSMTDDRRLEGDDACTGQQRMCDLGLDL